MRFEADFVGFAKIWWIVEQTQSLGEKVMGWAQENL